MSTSVYCKIDLGEKYMVITDEGRSGKMRYTARRLQKINYIPSHFNNFSYRQEIKGLIEDPLTKKSDQSYFIQICDMISFIFYQYTLLAQQIGTPPSRISANFTENLLTTWMDKLLPIINIKASPNSPYGIVLYPK